MSVELTSLQITPPTTPRNTRDASSNGSLVERVPAKLNLNEIMEDSQKFLKSAKDWNRGEHVFEDITVSINKPLMGTKVIKVIDNTSKKVLFRHPPEKPPAPLETRTNFPIYPPMGSNYPLYLGCPFGGGKLGVIL